MITHVENGKKPLRRLVLQETNVLNAELVSECGKEKTPERSFDLLPIYLPFWKVGAENQGETFIHRAVILRKKASLRESAFPKACSAFAVGDAAL